MDENQSSRILTPQYQELPSQHHDEVYKGLLEHVLTYGQKRDDRTGTGTISVFGAQARYNLRENFPLLTTKKLHTRSITHELLWFLAGDTNIGYLQDNGVSIWDEWADENGDLGPVYGKQWRSWETPSDETVDQIANVVDSIQNNPYSRRHMVVAYNPADVPEMALPPCHSLFQFYVDPEKKELSCELYQRSADLFLGVPFNIASYAMLTHMIAEVTDLGVGDFVHSFGDLHIYQNHLEQVAKQLTREPRESPTLVLPKKERLEDYVYDDFVFENYDPHPIIKAPIAV